MKMKYSVLAFPWCVAYAARLTEKESYFGKSEKNVRKNINTSRYNRHRHRLQEEPCVLMLKEVIMEDHSEIEEVECYDPSTEMYAIIPDQNSQENLLTLFKSNTISSGISTLIQDGAYFDDEEGSLILAADYDSIQYADQDSDGNLTRRLATTGIKRMVAVRVIANDASTTSSENFIRDAWFGTNGDIINLKSQYEACSYDKVQINPANTQEVKNGAYTVTISRNVHQVSDSAVRDSVVQKAKADLGALSQFDHVMLCLPPGTRGNWIAYAYVGHYLSVYNDKWCNYVSAQMHEIGHNLGLGHSGESSTYDDRSGMMGYSYSSDDGPRMCFNAPKSWQLGWYEDKHVTITNNWSGNIYGIADYGSSTAENVILRIPATSASQHDLYISFNRKKGVNSGTRRGYNKVLIHSQIRTSGFHPSFLLAELSAGGFYESNGVFDIYVDFISTSSDPGFAKVTISDGLPSPKPPTSPPAPQPSSEPNSPPTFLPDCGVVTVKKDCNRSPGCGFKVKKQKCRIALSSEKCSKFNGKRGRCRKNGCKWKNNTMLCEGRWDNK